MRGRRQTSEFVAKISEFTLAAVFDDGRVTHLAWRLAGESNSFTLKIATNWPPYLPWPIEVKPPQLNHFERQVVFLLSTPPVIRDEFNVDLQDRQPEHRLA